MEQFTPQIYAHNQLEERADFNHGLVSAQRIDRLVSVVEAFTREGIEVEDCVIGKTIHTLASWQDGHWKGVALESIAFEKDSNSDKLLLGDRSSVVLKRRTDGVGRISIENTMFDEKGYSYGSCSLFEFSPYRPIITYQAEGQLYSREDSRAYDYPRHGNQENLRTSIDITLTSAERTIGAIADYALRNGASTLKNTELR